MKVKKIMHTLRKIILLAVVLSLTACGNPKLYKDTMMDFGSIKTIAVMPFGNLTRELVAADRVRDVFMTMLLATGELYVLPQGEVAKGIITAGIINPTAPSKDEVIKFGALVKADAIITGVVREYGEVRSGTAAANVISISVQMTEVQSGKVVMSISATRGGISIWDRLFGGGGEPMNTITEKTIQDVIDSILK